MVKIAHTYTLTTAATSGRRITYAQYQSLHNNKKINIMYDLRVSGAMTFPHYLTHKTEETTKKTKVVGQEWDEQQKKTVDKLAVYTMAGKGLFTIICRPEKLVQVGEQFASLTVKGISYTINEIVEAHDAKGDWSFIDFIPTSVTCRCTID